VGRRPRGVKRFTRALVVVGIAAGVFAATSAAIAFTDESCANDSGCRPPEGVVEAPYSHKVEIRVGGGTAPYTYTVLAGALPPGLSLNSSTGAITGTPSASGTYTFYIDGGDACPDASSCINSGDTPPCNPGSPEIGGTCRFAHSATQRDFTIIVIPRLLVTDQVPGPATVGTAYSFGVTAVLKSGPAATSPTSSPVTWSVQVGQLPPGLTLGADGVISGTPTAVGSYSFTLLAVLDPKRSDTKAVKIDVRAPVAIAARVVPRSEIGVPFRLVLVASGGTGTYTWSLTSGTLPLGVALGADGTIVGTPRTAGAFRFTATATDTEGRKADYPGAINVAQRLAIATRLLRPAKVGHAYRQKVVTIFGVLPKVLKVTKGPLPRGIRYDRTLGVLSGTPTKPGTYRITFLAMDALKVQSTKTLKLVVTA